VRLNPFVEAAPTYPLSRVAGVRREAAERGAELIDLSLGQPSDPISSFLREALTEAIAATPFDAYPTSEGLPALREAIAGWVARRFGATLGPDTEVMPTLGSKEPIATLARLFAAPGDAIAVATPGYPVPDRSARFAGLRVIELPLSAAGGWLPDPDAVPWGEVAIVWLTSPHNPTGAIAPPGLVAVLAERCRAHGALLAVDEAYSELWFEGPPPGSALALEDRSGLVVFNSLSKRTGVPGLRSGFAAGDPEIVGRMKRHRVDVGTTPQAFVQRASIAAWEDEAHVDAARASYAARRALLRDAFARDGLEHAGGPGGMFLWLRAPDGDDVRAFESLAARGVLTVSGSWLGPGGAGHLRASFTRPLAELERAAQLLAAAG
jgi:aspartate/methionine/tyrosine aminotransferase